MLKKSMTGFFSFSARLDSEDFPSIDIDCALSPLSDSLVACAAGASAVSDVCRLAD